jgi:peptidoglycan/xylan/chitin deacetylase (PgdA/CDA1 family)
MKLSLRIDDIGASSKQFELYSKYPLCNVFFLKQNNFWGSWGPYREMTPDEWEQVFEILNKYNAKLTVSITACWVDKNNSLIPFPVKFPEEAKKLKEGFRNGLIEIANHGLTHCVVGKHLPKLFSSNREFHREFWDWVDEEQHFEHVRKAQQILQDYFETKVTTFVPPGNVYAEATISAAKQNGIKLINCLTIKQTKIEGINVKGNDNMLVFHDREFVLKGTDWLEEQLSKTQDAEYCFVRDL